MAQGLSLEDLVRMGAKPEEPAAPSGHAKTYEELVQSGAVDPSKIKVDPHETFLSSATSAIPLGKPLVNLGETGAMQVAKLFGVGEPGARLTPQAKAELAAKGEPVDDLEASTIKGPVDTYRDVRDTNAVRAAVGSERNPLASKLGTGTGIALSILAPAKMLPTVKVGSGIGGRLASGALTGAAYGGVTGLTEGKADITRGEIKQALIDFLSGAGMGAWAGLGAAGVVEAVRPLAGLLGKYGVGQGRRALTSGADQLSTRGPISEEAVRAAVGSKAIQPLGTVGGTFNRLEKSASIEGKKYAAILDQLEKMGVKGPVADDIVRELTDLAEKKSKEVTDMMLPNTYLREAEGIERLGKMTGAEGRLGLSQAEKTKQYLQEKAKDAYSRTKRTSLGDVKKEIASVVRAANETVVDQAGKAAGEGSPIKELAEQFVPVKKQVGSLIEAREAARRGSARAAQRMTGGMPDKISATTAIATGNPLAMLVTPAVNYAKNVWPSTSAYGALTASEALKSGAASSELAKYVALLSQPKYRTLREYLERQLATEDKSP